MRPYPQRDDEHEVFAYARDLARSIEDLLNPLPDGTDWMGDDATDDLDGLMTMLDLCSRALRSDERRNACGELVHSWVIDGPTHPHLIMPNDFDPPWFDSYHDLAAGTLLPRLLPNQED